MKHQIGGNDADDKRIRAIEHTTMAGNQVPESLTTRAALNAAFDEVAENAHDRNDDSAHDGKPDIQIDRSVDHRMSHTTIEPARPPKKPSQLFLGEIFGAILCKAAADHIGKQSESRSDAQTPTESSAPSSREPLRAATRDHGGKHLSGIDGPKTVTATSAMRVRGFWTYHRPSESTSRKLMTVSQTGSTRADKGNRTAADSPMNSFRNLRRCEPCDRTRSSKAMT